MEIPVKHSIKVGVLAQRQMNHAFAWYQDTAPEEMGRLFEAIEEAKRRISDNPLLFKEMQNGLRRIALQVFPYHIWYVIDEKHIIVVAFTHFRQNTSYLVDSSEKPLSLAGLYGFLPNYGVHLTIEEMNDAIGDAIAEEKGL